MRKPTPGGERALPGLPPGMLELWQQGERPRRGPRPGLSVEAITTAAIEIADSEGLSAVSMARVAKELGVTTMALYRYVPSKEALLVLMADAVAPPPLRSDYSALPRRARLEAWCRDQLALFVQHPWTAQLTSLPAVGPNRVAWIEQGLRALAGVAVPESLKTAVIGLLSLHLLTEGQLRVAFQVAGSGGESEHPALLDYASLLRALTTPQDHPAITAALDAGAFGGEGDGSVDQAELGLTMLLDGVEAVLERASGPRHETRDTSRRADR